MLKYFIETNRDDLIFVRNSYRRLIYVAMFLLLINCALVALLYFNLLKEPRPPYFATTSDGRIINIHPI